MKLVKWVKTPEWVGFLYTVISVLSVKKNRVNVRIQDSEWWKHFTKWQIFSVLSVKAENSSIIAFPSKFGSSLSKKVYVSLTFFRKALSAKEPQLGLSRSNIAQRNEAFDLFLVIVTRVPDQILVYVFNVHLSGRKKKTGIHSLAVFGNCLHSPCYCPC